MLDPLATSGNTKDASLLIHARDTYGVELVPITVQHRKGSDPTWAESFTKLLAFNQTQYNRVLSIDSDSTLLQNIDELFLSPPATVAVPRAYWLYPEKKIVASHIMLVQPSVAEFARIVEKVDHAGKEEYDMEIINDLYKDSAMILPHRPYALLTRSFGGDHQDYYLGNGNEVWDAVTVYNEAKYLHFSDWPMHKPWLKSSDSLVKERQPDCIVRDGKEDCTARELWLSFYTDFRERRSAIRSHNSKAEEASRGHLPRPITKDSRKTIKSVETEISWIVTTSFITYTNIEYYPIITTEVSLLTSTATQAEIATHTRKIKCTPSASDSSFYLLATIAPAPSLVPVYNNRYVLANPQFELFTENGVLFEPQYTPDRSTASVFILDSKGRIVTQTSYGDHFFASDDFNDFDLVHFLPRGWIQARRGHNGEDVGFDYVYCTMQPPSGRYVGGFKELACTQGYFNATVLQYCPLYDEYFRTGTVLGADYSATTPDCLLVTYLVVPVCGG
ncbi:uncharacterized protein N0V96_012094 [Colletotrichum fioriniae]|uniref:uncharacterized protein n=1 Tax=Colletotrichum fioriniae TaxID=710243 RepID=UPI0032DB3F32|nr:hypothetical protein N0V96_012094 [Colletotrichum fioriniae]